MVLLALSGVLLMAPAGILPVHAYCSGNVSDSWTPRTGVTISITSNACPGVSPHNSATCTRDLSILIDRAVVNGYAEVSGACCAVVWGDARTCVASDAYGDPSPRCPGVRNVARAVRVDWKDA